MEIARKLSVIMLPIRIIGTKVPALDQNLPKSIRWCCQESIRRLNQKSLYGCLFHCANNIEQSAMALEALTALKKEGLIKNIGVSLYNPDELDYLLCNNLQFDIIQVPYNIFDQRFENYFSRLKEKNIKIHIRSIFLQGLFFLTREMIADKFTIAVKNMNKLRNLSFYSNITILELCICFVFMNSFIDKIVTGIDSIRQLKDNIDALKCLDKTAQVYSSLKTLRIDDESIILPYKWK